jgi:thiol-disulfide isomerase/thioredoxin
MDKVIKLIGAIVVVALVLSVAFVLAESAGKATPAPAAPAGGSEPIYFFYGEECPHCHAVMPFIVNLSKKYPAANIQVLEVWHNTTNQQTYNAVLKRLNVAPSGVPTVVIGETVLVGDVDIPAKLEGLILQRLKK